LAFQARSSGKHSLGGGEGLGTHKAGRIWKEIYPLIA